MTLKYEHPETGNVHEVVMVHATEQPGSLILDRMTGVILTPIMSRPDWAEGLATALLDEHRHFWKSRLGTYAEPELFDFRDLGFIGVNEAGDQVELFADTEYRMEVLATILEVDRDDGDINKALADYEIGLDHYREDGEVAALEEAGADIEERKAQA